MTALSCVRMLDFKRIDPIIAIGYEYAQVRIAEWQKSRRAAPGA